MRASLFRLNAFAISRRLAAFFLLFSLFEITARGQNFSAQIINYNLEIPSWQTATFLNNGTSGVNGAYFTNYGTVQADSNFQVGTFNWAVFNQNGGTFNVNDYLSIARNSGSGTIQVNGGWVNAWNRPIIVGESGNGSIGINGGGVYAPNGTVLSGNAGSVGSLDLNSGILVTSQIYKWGGGTGNLTLNGGTLKATRDESNFISGLNSANIGGNGAVIDNDGKGIGINQTLTGSGSGSVKFDGSGRTTLRQNNTYTGDTLVRGGVLQFYENGSLYNNGTAAGNIYVDSGASLYFNKQDVFGNAGTGSSSPVTITLNGGTINNAGVFNNLANLTMNGGNLNASGGSADGWNAYMLNNVSVGGSSASTITSNTSINGNNAILLSRAGPTTFDVGSTGDATGDLKVSAKLTDGNGVVGSLTKNGLGKMVLSAANTYTGETKVLAGTLAVNTGGSIVSSSTIISSGATLQGAGSIAALTVESGGVVKITTASTNSAGAWNTGGAITFSAGSKIDVSGVSLSQQPYVLIRGSSVSGTPTLQGATGFTVSNASSMIGLTPTLDTDGDGLTDYQEGQLGTDINNSDTDSDGLTDGQEVNTYSTNPALADTDGDGTNDNTDIYPLTANHNFDVYLGLIELCRQDSAAAPVPDYPDGVTTGAVFEKLVYATAPAGAGIARVEVRKSGGVVNGGDLRSTNPAGPGRIELGQYAVAGSGQPFELAMGAKPSAARELHLPRPIYLQPGNYQRDHQLERWDGFGGSCGGCRIPDHGPAADRHQLDQRRPLSAQCHERGADLVQQLDQPAQLRVDSRGAGEAAGHGNLGKAHRGDRRQRIESAYPDGSRRQAFPYQQRPLYGQADLFRLEGRIGAGQSNALPSGDGAADPADGTDTRQLGGLQRRQLGGETGLHGC
jgi:autotransporter-associated beta strand protein